MRVIAGDLASRQQPRNDNVSVKGGVRYSRRQRRLKRIAKNSDLPTSSYRKYTPYQRQHLLATLVTVAPFSAEPLSGAHLIRGLALWANTSACVDLFENAAQDLSSSACIDDLNVGQSR